MTAQPFCQEKKYDLTGKHSAQYQRICYWSLVIVTLEAVTYQIYQPKINICDQQELWERLPQTRGSFMTWVVHDLKSIVNQSFQILLITDDDKVICVL